MLSLNFLSPVPSLIPPFLVLLLLFRLLLLGLCHRVPSCPLWIMAFSRTLSLLDRFPFLSTPLSQATLHVPIKPSASRHDFLSDFQVYLSPFNSSYRKWQQFTLHTVLCINQAAHSLCVFVPVTPLCGITSSGFISWWPLTEEPLPLTSFDGVRHCYLPSAPSLPLVQYLCWMQSLFFLLDYDLCKTKDDIIFVFPDITSDLIWHIEESQ